MKRREFIALLGGAAAASAAPLVANARPSGLVCPPGMSTGMVPLDDLAEPFGLSTIAAPEGPLRTIWRELQAQMRVERSIIEQCRSGPSLSGSPAVQRFIGIVREADRYSGLARIGRINRAVNLALGMAGSSTVPKWTTPLHALDAGYGDCKQFAVLKYAALEQAGFPPNSLRLVVVGIRSLEMLAHAMVAINYDSKWWILNNRSMEIAESRELLKYYEPLFTLDDGGVRKFVSSKEVAGSGCVARAG